MHEVQLVLAPGQPPGRRRVIPRHDRAADGSHLRGGRFFEKSTVTRKPARLSQRVIVQEQHIPAWHARAVLRP